ncbi:MAG: hypothetical protein V1872_11155, partial [bacterium]
DWVITLPDGLEIEFNNEIIKYEEEIKMAFVIPAEKIWLEKGREKGREEGREEGRKKGEFIGGIRVAQLMKGIKMSSKKELEKMTVKELKIKLKEVAGEKRK